MNENDTEKILCNNCKRDNYKLYIENSGFNIVKCNYCGLVYVNPQPTLKYLIKFYSEGEYTDKNWNKEPVYEEIVNNGRLKVVKYIDDKYINKKVKLLDVGCGMNAQHKYMETLGWDVLGTELSKTFVKYAKKKGLNVEFGDVIDMNFKHKEFDVITIMAVLEHLKDPRKYIGEFNRILSDDGLLIIKIPNLHYALKNAATLSISQVGHLFYYTPTTIKELLEDCGFTIIKNEPVLECGSENKLKHIAMVAWDKVASVIYKLFGCHTNLQMVIYAKKGWVEHHELMDY